MDNASVCNVIARLAGIMLLKKYGLNFHEGNAHICCMAHVVNLIVQSLLASLDEAADPDSEDYYIPNKHLPFYYDPEDDDEVIEMENEADGNKDADDEDDEFVEFLHLDLGDEELKDKLEDELNETLNLSEVTKVCLHIWCPVCSTHLDDSYMQSQGRYVLYLSAERSSKTSQSKPMAQVQHQHHQTSSWPISWSSVM